MIRLFESFIMLYKKPTGRDLNLNLTPEKNNENEGDRSDITFKAQIQNNVIQRSMISIFPNANRLYLPGSGQDWYSQPILGVHCSEAILEVTVYEYWVNVVVVVSQ